MAEVDERDVRATMSRVNAAPSATISGEIVGEDTGAISGSVRQELDRLEDSGELPAGVSVQVGASASSRWRPSAACWRRA